MEMIVSGLWATASVPTGSRRKNHGIAATTPRRFSSKLFQVLAKNK
jgi:hypothetical protein